MKLKGIRMVVSAAYALKRQMVLQQCQAQERQEWKHKFANTLMSPFQWSFCSGGVGGMEELQEISIYT